MEDKSLDTSHWTKDELERVIAAATNQARADVDNELIGLTERIAVAGVAAGNPNLERADPALLSLTAAASKRYAVKLLDSLGNFG